MKTRELSRKTPNTFVILFILVLIASALTYIIPAGEYQRVKDSVTGLNIAVPGSFHAVEASSVAPWLIPLKFFEAISSSSVSKLLAFIFIIGGSFEIVIQSGCIEAICGKVIAIFKDKGILIIPVFVAIFSIFGFTMGLSTASIIFVPIGISIARALGFDSLTGMAMVMLGTNAGFAAGVYNPFSVGIAQNIAELPMFSGAWIRWLLLPFLLLATSLYIVRYARKAKGENTALSLSNQELWRMAQMKAGTDKIKARQIIVLIIFSLTLVIITVGISNFDWDISKLGAAFLLMGLVSGIAAGFGLNKTCDIFAAGCKKMINGAIVISIAATMRQVLTDGNILDSITNYLINTTYSYPRWAQLMGMFYANAAIDPIITSGSAHAAVVMPIMVPMADALSLSRQSAVFAFQLGDGLVNLVSPISTTLTSCLAVSEIPYGKWLKFFIPLVIIYMLIGTGFIFLAALTGY